MESDQGEIDNKRKIEAVLFVSGRFLTMQDLVSFSDLNPILIREIISQLKKDYEKRGSAIQIVQKGSNQSEEIMWKMDVLSDYANLTNRMATGSSEFSKAEQSTLALVAFKQPIKQSVIIKIRGNKAYDHIRKFSNLGLIRKKKTGHTYELSLSNEFYDYFNVAEQDLLSHNPEK